MVPAFRLMSLSPVEHLFSGAAPCPISFAFRYDRPLDVERLNASFTRISERFPWLATRLTEGETGLSMEPATTPELECREVTELVLGGGVEGAWIEPIETTEQVARFRISNSPSGSVLAATMSHAVVDGFSFMHFMSSWARECLGKDSPAPVRKELTGKEYSAVVEPAQVLASTGGYWIPGQGRAAACARVTERVRFEAEQLKRWRAEARACHGVMLSDSDLITGQLWKRSARMRLDPERPCSVTCPVDLRALLGAAWRTHFGCAILFATAELPLQQVRRRSALELAVLVRESIAAVTPERVFDAVGLLDGLKSQVGVRELDKFHFRHPDTGLAVTNLTRMPIEELDFGAGAPVEHEVDSQYQRTAALFAVPGGVEARVCWEGSGEL